MITFVTYSARPDLISDAKRIEIDAYPAFLNYESAFIKHWDTLDQDYPDYQLIGLDNHTGEIIGVAYTAPIKFHGNLENLPAEGWNWVMSNFKRDASYHAGLSIVINKNFQGLGYAKYFIQAIKELGENKQHAFTIIPVRPTFKKYYPLISMNDYIKWQNKKGDIYDPWLRLHLKQGGKIIKICSHSMQVEMSVASWQEYMNVEIIGSGSYVIEGGLTTVEIDIDNDIGVYFEPNVWMLHAQC